jgi:hypothetical protein
MLLVLALGCWLGWYVRRVRVQQQAVAAIKKAGGSVAYDWEWDRYDPNIVDATGTPRPRAPRWIAACVGVDYVANVVHVNLVPHRTRGSKLADDETLKHVGKLQHVESLWLNGTAISDAGLAHIRRLTRLRDLTIGDTQVTDAGLASLRGMTRLGTLFLAGSRVTDDGVLGLERALPRVQILREDDILASRFTARAANDLDFARSQPIRVACLLLEHRAMAMAARGDEQALIATIHALCDLEPTDQVSLLKLAQACAQCVGMLEPPRTPRLSASERQTLQRRCTDRGIAALTRAVELGYDNVRRLDGDLREVGVLWNFRNNPAYPELVERMKQNRR